MMTLSKCEPPATSYGVPINSYVNNQLTAPNNNYNTPNNNYNAPNNNYNAPNNNNYNGAHHNHEGQDPDHNEVNKSSSQPKKILHITKLKKFQPKSYEFGYAVKDDYSGNDYKRRETSDGNQVTGEYRVQLPDGRTQIVTYYADWQSGFHADVRYEGTAQYPDQQQQYPGNAYQNPGNQYGAPNLNNQYGAPFNNQGFNSPSSASSSVTIKDFSGPSTPYNTGSHNNNNNGGYNYANNGNNFNGADNYDSYANNGNFGSRSRPSTGYGAP